MMQISRGHLPPKLRSPFIPNDQILCSAKTTPSCHQFRRYGWLGSFLVEDSWLMTRPYSPAMTDLVEPSGCSDFVSAGEGARALGGLEDQGIGIGEDEGTGEVGGEALRSQGNLSSSSNLTRALPSPGSSPPAPPASPVSPASALLAALRASRCAVVRFPDFLLRFGILRVSSSPSGTGTENFIAAALRTRVCFSRCERLRFFCNFTILAQFQGISI